MGCHARGGLSQPRARSGGLARRQSHEARAHRPRRRGRIARPRSDGPHRLRKPGGLEWSAAIRDSSLHRRHAPFRLDPGRADNSVPSGRARSRRVDPTDRAARSDEREADDVAAETAMQRLQDRAPRAIRVVDENLGNCKYLGTIQRLFPRARILGGLDSWGRVSNDTQHDTVGWNERL